MFTIFGSGAYRIQPIFVEDVAEIAVRAAHQSDNVTLDATGPETITFEGLVRLIANKIGSRARLIHVRPGLALFLSRLMGYAVRDVVLTRDEMEGLIANLLISEGPPMGQTQLSDWLEQNADDIGVSYTSEMSRHYR